MLAASKLESHYQNASCVLTAAKPERCCQNACKGSLNLELSPITKYLSISQTVLHVTSRLSVLKHDTHCLHVTSRLFVLKHDTHCLHVTSRLSVLKHDTHCLHVTSRLSVLKHDTPLSTCY